MLTNLTLHKKIFMRQTHYFLAFILILGWSTGYFGYAEGGLIHLILVIGMIVFATGITYRKKSFLN